MQSPRVLVIGTGYVGLVSGACFADLGFNVVCADRDPRKIDMLRNGEVPIYEPGLADVVARNAGRLTFTTDLAAEVAGADIIFIAVGTPTMASGEADLSAVLGVAAEVAPLLSGFTVITIKSTVPVGTADRVREIIRNANPDADFDVASNPEFLREGSAVGDFLEPDRIVVGLRDGRAEPLFRTLYKPLTDKGAPIVFMSNEAAEVTKYAANTYLAMRVAFVNQLADICEAVGADITDVTRGIGLDKRVGQHYLSPGPGFGGSCFPKDTRALLVTTRRARVDFSLGEAIVSANDKRKDGLADRVAEAIGGSVIGKQIAVLGLAFKADTDDVRDSSSIPLIRVLQDMGAVISAYDPAANEQASQVLSDVHFYDSAAGALEGADVAVVMTEWPEFRSMDLARFRDAMKAPVVVDFRNLYGLDAARTAGITYISMGRAAVGR